MYRRTAFSLIVLVMCCRCDFTEGVKQVRCTADLQTITAKIENGKAQAYASRKAIADVEGVVHAAVTSVNRGRDPWGNPYVWQVRQGAKGTSYVVLSTGSDGRLDVPSINDYFAKSTHEVLKSSEHHRDIVFRDGDALITGGK